MPAAKGAVDITRNWWKAALSAVLVLACILCGFVWYLGALMHPTAASETGVRISYPKGTGLQELAAQLEEKDVIRNAKAFILFVKYKGEGTRFQAGEYMMYPGMKLESIVSQLNRGETVKEETVRLTVPEGFTIRQIAEKVAELGMDADSFVTAARDYQGGEGQAIRQIPANPAIRERLEGYLFPETYEWKKGASPQDMLDRMAQELDKRLQQLPADWQQVMAQRKLNLHEVMTIASLIEREVVLDEERPLVAGVIHNRLNKRMPLQIDATIQYLFDKQKDRLFEKDLQVESPYNTYLHTGLPPGPIASPSLASIRAALYPEETKFLFYVTKKDGSKGHLFAETYEEHLKNIAESKK
ncbi:endolytic transglycosylase MltG [Paenibacillus silviterrae]|uniref:endolytic transglycosylase MltG n=1 Tax=Paenibacillus silviterrae TaxID=3242194 RepID=UPI00254332EB|nr:endolytic transglycosylase MltG [Paenibacillus chinjuensis]